MSFKWALILLLLLNACGQGKSAGLIAYPPGITSDAGDVDQKTVDRLAGDFYDTQDCLDIFLGGFEKLQIEIVDGLFDCPDAIGGKCSAFFQAPNRIKLGFLGEAKKEYFHYLKYLQTGDSDSTHADSNYLACT